MSHNNDVLVLQASVNAVKSGYSIENSIADYLLDLKQKISNAERNIQRNEADLQDWSQTLALFIERRADTEKLIAVSQSKLSTLLFFRWFVPNEWYEEFKEKYENQIHALNRAKDIDTANIKLYEDSISKKQEKLYAWHQTLAVYNSNLLHSQALLNSVLRSSPSSDKKDIFLLFSSNAPSQSMTPPPPFDTGVTCSL